MDKLNELTLEQLNTMSLGEVHTHLQEIPQRYDFRVYEAKMLYKYLSEALEAYGTQTERNIARDIWNMQEMILSVFPKASIEGYFDGLSHDHQNGLQTVRKAILNWRASAKNGMAEDAPPHEGLQYVGACFNRGQLNLTFSTRFPTATPTDGYITDTREWMEKCGALTAKNMYVNERTQHEYAEQQKRNVELQELLVKAMQNVGGLDERIAAILQAGTAEK